MDALSLNVDNQYLKAFQEQKHTTSSLEAVDKNIVDIRSTTDSKIHNSAVNVSISMESIKVFLNIKSVEMSQQNTSAQKSLMNIINNTEVYDFLAGRELDSGLSLKSIGYDGKPITELSAQEAKTLVSDEGFFGIINTSNRVSSFSIDLAKEDVEALQAARQGLVRGFEEAERMWGGNLPEMSYETQERTLKIVDEKIAELLKTDAQKELESTE